MNNKELKPAKPFWDEEPDPTKDFEEMLDDLRSQPDFFGKDHLIQQVKRILPETHSENIDVEIENTQ